MYDYKGKQLENTAWDCTFNFKEDTILMKNKIRIESLTTEKNKYKSPLQILTLLTLAALGYHPSLVLASRCPKDFQVTEQSRIHSVDHYASCRS